jgi:hypothetical protein
VNIPVNVILRHRLRYAFGALDVHILVAEIPVKLRKRFYVSVHFAAMAEVKKVVGRMRNQDNYAGRRGEKRRATAHTSSDTAAQ